MTDLEEMAYQAPLPRYDLDRVVRIPRPGVTAVIACHPARFGHSLPDSPAGAGKLANALQSVMKQTRQPDAVVIANDTERSGAAINRQRALDMVQTEWMAWLDSDDEWYPQHLEALLRTAEATGAAFVFSWFDTEFGDPLGHFGLPFNPATPHHTTITFLVKTELAREVGFRGDAQVATPGAGFICGNEDWLHIVEMCRLMVERDLPAVHLAERTWFYRIDGWNSSGVAGQGDAA